MILPRESPSIGKNEGGSGSSRWLNPGMEALYNTASKNRLICLSSDFLLHFTLIRGGIWIKWGLKQVLSIENQLFLARPNTQVLGLQDRGMDNAFPRKFNSQESRL
jgi:hypothetical protein